MLHLTRGLWKDDGRLLTLTEKKIHQAVNDDPAQLDRLIRRLAPSQQVKDMYAMLLRGEEGPPLLEQARIGLESGKSLQELGWVFKTLDMRDVYSFVVPRRVGAQRFGKLPYDVGGQNLAKDLSTRVCDDAGCSVMNGTSGSGSDFLLLAQYAAKELGQPWADPSLNDEAARVAMIKLVHHFFRHEKSAMPAVLAKVFNQTRAALDLPPMDVAPDSVFTHSIFESALAVILMINGKYRHDLGAVEAEMRRIIPSVKQWLEPYMDERKNEW